MFQRSTGWLARVLPAVMFLSGCLGSSEEPQPIEMVSLRSVDVGALHACGLTAGGQAYCWGANGSGQLGQGQFSDQLSPRPVSQGNIEFVELQPGGGHTCALALGGELYCWGNNSRGQLGQGSRSPATPQPTQVLTTLAFVSATAGGAHSCGLTAAGAAWCWGSAEFGRLGNSLSGFNTVRSTPDSVRRGLTFTSLTAGGEHTCGLTTDSTAYCWGRGTRGQLGDGTTGTHEVPAAVAGNLVFTQISAGGEHTCAVTPDGNAYCWGRGDSGQLGNAAPASRDIPTLVSGGLGFASVSAGGSHTCGLVSSSEAYCWGLNASGQLGDGSTTSRLVPTRVSGNILFQSVEAGGAQFDTASCGYGLDNIAYCWGFGGSGQTGSGNLDNALSPVRVAGQPG